MFAGMVRRSERYMASGFSAFSPMRKATVGEVGLTIRSKRSKTAACSWAMTVRTFWAWP